MRTTCICVFNSVLHRNRLEKTRAMETKKISCNLSRRRCGCRSRCSDGSAATGSRRGFGDPRLPSHGWPTTYLCHSVRHRRSFEEATCNPAFIYLSNGSNSFLENSSIKNIILGHFPLRRSQIMMPSLHSLALKLYQSTSLRSWSMLRSVRKRLMLQHPYLSFALPNAGTRRKRSICQQYRQARQDRLHHPL